jgi:hypothetical protein
VVERWLARLSTSPHAEQLVLKAGMLLAAYDARRPTDDVDARARGLANDQEAVVARKSRARPPTMVWSSSPTRWSTPRTRAVVSSGMKPTRAGWRMTVNQRSDDYDQREAEYLKSLARSDGITVAVGRSLSDADAEVCPVGAARTCIRGFTCTGSRRCRQPSQAADHGAQTVRRVHGMEEATEESSLRSAPRRRVRGPTSPIRRALASWARLRSAR